MVAGVIPAADVTVYLRRLQPARGRGAQQQVVEAQAGISPPGISEIVPERVDPFIGMQVAHSVKPSLLHQAREGLADLGPEQGIIPPPLRRVNVKIGRASCRET